jgi:2-polyprenyl-3-methyl-5-hydroxy-6-metoxy-1,4-benzoquinol methylase
MKGFRHKELRLMEKSSNAKQLFARKDEAIQRLTERVETLKTKLEEARAMVAKKQDSIERLRLQLASFMSSEGVDTLAHNTQEGMDEFFSETLQEKIYESFGRVLREKIRERGIELDGRRVIDFGIGPGIVLEELLGHSKPSRLVGADFSTTALEHARKRLPAAHILQRDIYERIPERFDVAICTEVLEHLEAPDRALANLLRTVDRGGTLILTVPNGRIDRSHFHINFWSPESWRLFVQAGIDLDERVWSLETGTFSPQQDDIPRINYAIASLDAGTTG